MNAARKWTEVQEKMGGYDKSWEWFGDTALIAAARACHVEVVNYLLMEGADPTLPKKPQRIGRNNLIGLLKVLRAELTMSTSMMFKRMLRYS